MIKIIVFIIGLILFSLNTQAQVNIPIHEFELTDSTDCYFVYIQQCGPEVRDVIFLFERDISSTKIDSLIVNSKGKYPLTGVLDYNKNYLLTGIELEGQRIWSRISDQEIEPWIVQLDFGKKTNLEKVFFDLGYNVRVF